MNNNIIRIIGGIYKGRKVTILPNSNIRPTPDRVRETLFNWLMHDIQNARVLDVFTGSGAMSIESLSRGAGFAFFNDKNTKIVNHINQILTTFNVDASKFKSSNLDALKLLEKTPHGLNLDPFDIIILDPPFNNNLVSPCLDLIIKNSWLNTSSVKKTPLIYLETEKNFDLNILRSHNLEIIKEKYTGNVFYSLLQLSSV